MNRLLLLSLLLLQVSCATMFSDDDSEVTIASEPVGAIVFLDGRRMGVSPISFFVKSDTFQDHYVRVSKDGFKTKKFTLRKTLNKTSLWNLGFALTTFGALSFATDAGTGALLEFAPKSYLVDLTTGLSSDSPNQLIKNQNPSSKGSVSSFILVNEISLKKDIARGGGESLEQLVGWSHVPIQAMIKDRILSQKHQLLSMTDSLEFMRELKELLKA